MPLATCRECEHQVSSEAPNCPNCGAPSPARRPSEDWSPCVHCGSAITQQIGAGAIVLASIAGAGCMIWIPVIGWILAPILLLIAMVAVLSAVIPSGKLAFQCRDCKKWFTRPKSELI